MEEPLSKAFWELVANWGAWAVIIGVFGEGGEILVKIITLQCEKKKTGQAFLAWRHKWEVWIEIFGIACWMLVVAGLAIEHSASGRVQEISAEESRQLTRELSVATTNAAVAIEQAGIANLRAAQLNERANLAESNNLVLRTNVVALEKDLIGAREQITQIRKREYRKIDPIQRRKFLEFTKNIKDPKAVSVDFTWNPEDPESVAYATALMSLLTETGIEATGRHSLGNSKRGAGVELWRRDWNGVTAREEMLVAMSFMDSGIPIKLVSNLDAGLGVQVFVGSKPDQ